MECICECTRSHTNTQTNTTCSPAGHELQSCVRENVRSQLGRAHRNATSQPVRIRFFFHRCYTKQKNPRHSMSCELSFPNSHASLFALEVSSVALPFRHRYIERDCRANVARKYTATIIIVSATSVIACKPLGV